MMKLGSDKKKALSFIEGRHQAVLGTTNDQNNPATSVIFYVADKKGRIRFLTKSQTQKSHNIHRNAQVSLTVVDSSKPLATTVFGAAQEITDMNEKKKTVREILELAQEKLDDFAPIAKLTKGNFTVFEIEPKVVVYSDYTGKIHSGSEYNTRIDL